MEYAKKIKNYILSSADMDYCGICKASDLDGEPKGHRPVDLLPTAKSIIVFGRRMIDGAVQSEFRVFENKQMAAQTSYADHAHYLAVNFLMLNAVYNVAEHLERTYKINAMPVTFSKMQSVEPEGLPVPQFVDAYKAGLPLDIAKAAAAAGLGEIAYNHRFVTEDAGPRVNMVAIVTDMEFDEYDKPREGESLCDPSKCTICRDVCPTHAISGNGKLAEINCKGCGVACFGMRKELNPRTRAVIESDNPSDEEYGKAIKDLQNGVGQQMLDHLAEFYCDKCLVYCPIGNWYDRYKKQNLTKFEGGK